MLAVFGYHVCRIRNNYQEIVLYKTANRHERLSRIHLFYLTTQRFVSVLQFWFSKRFDRSDRAVIEILVDVVLNRVAFSQRFKNRKPPYFRSGARNLLILQRCVVSFLIYITDKNIKLKFTFSLRNQVHRFNQRIVECKLLVPYKITRFNPFF